MGVGPEGESSPSRVAGRWQVARGAVGATGCRSRDERSSIQVGDRDRGWAILIPLRGRTVGRAGLGRCLSDPTSGHRGYPVSQAGVPARRPSRDGSEHVRSVVSWPAWSRRHLVPGDRWSSSPQTGAYAQPRVLSVVGSDRVVLGPPPADAGPGFFHVNFGHGRVLATHHGHASWARIMGTHHGHASWNGIVGTHHGHASWPRMMHHGHASWPRIMATHHEHTSWARIMSTHHGHASWPRILGMHHWHASWNGIVCTHHGHASWPCIMATHHGHASWPRILATHHGHASWARIICTYHGYAS